MTILPCPTFPLAMHSTFGQNCVEAFICSSVVFCIDIVYRCLPLFQVAPASPPPVNAALPHKKQGVKSMRHTPYAIAYKKCTVFSTRFHFTTEPICMRTHKIMPRGA